jgi:hypothetical protein
VYNNTIVSEEIRIAISRLVAQYILLILESPDDGLFDMYTSYGSYSKTDLDMSHLIIDYVDGMTDKIEEFPERMIGYSGVWERGCEDYEGD